MKNENYVIVRANSAGVFFGQLVEKTSNEVRMKKVRKIYYWEGACAIEQIAVDGVDYKKSKLTVEVPEMEIFDVIQIIPCSEKAVNNLKSIPEWKQ